MSDYNFKGEFKQKHNFQKRLAEAQRVLDNYPNRIPIIVENDKYSKLPMMTKRKYLVPDDMTVGQFMYVVRKRMKLKSETAIYMFFDQTLAPTSKKISEVYKIYKDQDNFLYITVGAERTFGMSIKE